MRLIDADTIIDKSYWHGEKPTYDNPFPNGHDAVDVEDIDNAPTIDAVEVVRCKDCLHYMPMVVFDGECMCTVFDWKSEPMDYCSFAERKEVQK